MDSRVLLGAGSDVHQVDGAALADLLAERAGEALEGALGDALVVVLGLLRDGAEHEDAGVGGEAAHQRGEELLQREQLGRVS